LLCRHHRFAILPNESDLHLAVRSHKELGVRIDGCDEAAAIRARLLFIVAVTGTGFAGLKGEEESFFLGFVSV